MLTLIKVSITRILRSKSQRIINFTDLFYGGYRRVSDPYCNGTLPSIFFISTVLNLPEKNWMIKREENINQTLCFPLG